MSDLTVILERIERGDGNASAEILPLVYDELRRLAADRLAREQPGQTIQATELVHEAWLRLTGAGSPRSWNGRAHFFGAAVEAMRRILVERSRRKARIRHGGDLDRIALDDVNVATEDAPDTVLAINDALEKLAKQSPSKARIVELRYFMGMEHSEIARVLDVSEPTVRRHWAYARSWLYAELKGQA